MKTAPPTSRSNTSPACARSPTPISSALPTPSRSPNAGNSPSRRTGGPSLIVLARQDLPPLRQDAAENRSARGGYVLIEADGARQATLIATGSEVAIAVDARRLLAEAGIAAAVVSLPCWELFAQQDERYRLDVLGAAPRVGIEAACGFGWERWLGESGIFIGMTGFGASAPSPGPLSGTSASRQKPSPRPSAAASYSQTEGNLLEMAVKVAINGFGRIGRLVLRAIVERGRDDVLPVAINDLGSVETNAHLFRYDTIHGRFPGEVKIDGDSLTITYHGKTWGPIKVTAERDPSRVPYQGIDVALECTGRFTSKDSAHCPHRRRRRSQGPDLRPRRRRRRHHRLRRQRTDHHQARDDRHLERLLHHQLPRPHGQGPARPLRYPARLHGHHPRLHQRPEHPGLACTRTSTAPAPPP